MAFEFDKMKSLLKLHFPIEERFGTAATTFPHFYKYYNNNNKIYQINKTSYFLLLFKFPKNNSFIILVDRFLILVTLHLCACDKRISHLIFNKIRRSATVTYKSNCKN